MPSKIQPPPWLKKDILVFHNPTSTVFQPDRLYSKNDALILTDPVGQEWDVSECDRLKIDHLRKGGTFAGDTAIAIYAHPQGLIVSDGLQRKLIKLPAIEELDEGLRAARSLSQMFDGAIYSEEIEACSQEQQPS